MSTDTGV